MHCIEWDRDVIVRAICIVCKQCFQESEWAGEQMQSQYNFEKQGRRRWTTRAMAVRVWISLRDDERNSEEHCKQHIQNTPKISKQNYHYTPSSSTLQCPSDCLHSWQPSLLSSRSSVPSESLRAPHRVFQPENCTITRC